MARSKREGKHLTNKNIINSQFYKLLRYGYFFLVTNLLFLLANLLFLFVFISFPPKLENSVIYLVALLPMGPALTALFFSMGQLVRTGDLAPVKDFFRAYRANFWLSMKYWVLQLILSAIMIIDAIYFYQRDWLILAIVFLILFLLVCLFSLVGFPLLATFEIQLKSLYQATVVVIWQYALKQLMNLLTIVAFFITFWAFPSELFLFLFSLIAFYLMRQNQSMFETLAEQFSKPTTEGAGVNE